MKALAEFFAWVWGAIVTTFPRIGAIVATIGTALGAVVAYIQTVISGITSIGDLLGQFVTGFNSSLEPVRSAIAGNAWFMLFGYSVNLGVLLGIMQLIVTAVLSIVGVMVALTIGFLILYSGFVVIAYVLRVLKGVTASLIDFN